MIIIVVLVVAVVCAFDGGSCNSGHIHGNKDCDGHNGGALW
jgi:hypothetical protein